VLRIAKIKGGGRKWAYAFAGKGQMYYVPGIAEEYSFFRIGNSSATPKNSAMKVMRVFELTYRQWF